LFVSLILYFSATTLENEVACISSQTYGAAQDLSSFVVVGLWNDNTVRVLRADDLKQVFSVRSIVINFVLIRDSTCTSKVKIGSGTIPRSIVSVLMENTNYVLCALGDGSLYTFVRNEETGKIIMIYFVIFFSR
jgi:DNA damage-binding protein 1